MTDLPPRVLALANEHEFWRLAACAAEGASPAEFHPDHRRAVLAQADVARRAFLAELAEVAERLGRAA